MIPANRFQAVRGTIRGMDGLSGADGDAATGTGGSAPWHAPALLLATCGGVGRAAFAPGTWGSLVGIPLALATGRLAAWLAGTDGRLATLAVEAGIVAAICLVGVPVCTRAAALLGRGKDPGAIVFDEMAALPIVLLAVAPAERSAVWLAAAFVLFRIFDIAKPFPCRRLEGLPSGWGIMADDWAAAAWAAASLLLARALTVS